MRAQLCWYKVWREARASGYRAHSAKVSPASPALGRGISGKHRARPLVPPPLCHLLAPCEWWVWPSLIEGLTGAHGYCAGCHCPPRPGPHSPPSHPEIQPGPRRWLRKALPLGLRFLTSASEPPKTILAAQTRSALLDLSFSTPHSLSSPHSEMFIQQRHSLCLA